MAATEVIFSSVAQSPHARERSVLGAGCRLVRSDRDPVLPLVSARGRIRLEKAFLGCGKVLNRCGR